MGPLLLQRLEQVQFALLCGTKQLNGASAVVSVLRIGLSYHAGGPEYDAYASALERRAAAMDVPVECVWLAGSNQDLDANALESVEAICMTGGADVDPAKYGRAEATEQCSLDPRRDRIEWAILENVERRPRPLLAICRGAQILNVFHGGTLVPDLGALNVAHRGDAQARHDVQIEPNTLLADVTTSRVATVNTSHHQAIERIAPGFRASACAPDGVIEAFERNKRDGLPFLLAVQWHPELMDSGESLADKVLDAFLQAPLAPQHRAGGRTRT